MKLCSIIAKAKEVVVFRTTEQNARASSKRTFSSHHLHHLEQPGAYCSSATWRPSLRPSTLRSSPVQRW